MALPELRPRDPRPRRGLTTTLLLAVLAAGCTDTRGEEARAAEIAPWLGIHRASLTSVSKDAVPGGLPFLVEVEATGTTPEIRATLRNGDERIEVPHAGVTQGRLVLAFDHYDARIEVEPEASGEGRPHGNWWKQRAGDTVSDLSIEFEPLGDGVGATRFPPLLDPDGRELPRQDPSPWIGRWRVDFAEGEDPAIGLFEAREDHTVVGTFMTSLGDYRYLAGDVRDGTLRLSCFDGAHAFLFRASLDDADVAHGDFWSSGTWHETWTAVRDDEIELPDEFEGTHWREGVDLAELAFPDLDGLTRTLADPAFGGRARLIQVFGSWCPNCHDEGAYLVELKDRYGDRGLSILGLAFEHSGDPERDVRQVRRYLERHGADWPVLLAGPSNKSQATESLGALDRIKVYPTTIFVDHRNQVRAIHAGFSGPATGEAHARLREDFEGRIESLLAEAEAAETQPR